MALLEGKVVVVTGAGRGIGRAVALLCAREGASVVVNDLGTDREGAGVDPSVASAVAKEIADAGGAAVASHESVAAPDAGARVVDRALDAFGRLDALVSSAGFLRDRSLLKMDDADLDAMLDVYVRGAFGLTRAAARAMVDGGQGGAIVHTTAPAALFGSARQTAFAAASAAVIGLVRSAAIELKRHNVRINAIAPTARTRLTEDLPVFQGIREDSMTPEHVAPLAAFLVSPLATDVNGEILGVAGARLYALRTRETTGAFAEGRPFTPEEIRAAWGDITRGG